MTPFLREAGIELPIIHAPMAGVSMAEMFLGTVIPEGRPLGLVAENEAEARDWPRSRHGP